MIHDGIDEMFMSKYNYITAACAALLVILLVPIHGYPEKKGCVRKTLALGASSRSYMVYRPAGAAEGKPLPLVIMLHGMHGNGIVMSMISGFNELAEKNNFIVLYPDAYGPLWNDGRVDMDSISFTSGIDDVQFIIQLIDSMVASSEVDPGRVYVAGFSNGGMMALRIGIAASDRIAAVASVAGLMPKHLSQVRPGRPVPFLMIHGTEDRTVPWGGGVLMRSKKKRGEVLSVLDTVSYWVRNNGCTAQVSVRVLPDRETRDGTVSFLVTYGCPAPDDEVLLVSIQGGGHTWPGAEKHLPMSSAGNISRDFNASQFIWDFFSRHRRP